MEKSRSNFTGSIGFIFAAAGSAVGLGNLWRFPYLAAKYGGGIFLLVYLILAVTFGFELPLLLYISYYIYISITLICQTILFFRQNISPMLVDNIKYW